MNSSINLISTKNDDLELKLKRLRIVRSIAVASLVLIVLMSVGVFILTLQVPLASIKKEEASTLNDISYLHDKAAKLYLANDRVSNINNIIAKRKNYSEVVNKIVGLMPSDLSIDSLTITDQAILLTVSSNSLQSINQFLNSYVDFGNKGKPIDSVSVDNLVVNTKTGRYSLSFKAQVL